MVRIRGSSKSRAGQLRWRLIKTKTFGAAALINAGAKAVMLNSGAAFFYHADSFAMVRGGHLDVTIIGAYQRRRTAIW